MKIHLLIIIISFNNFWIFSQKEAFKEKLEECEQILNTITESQNNDIQGFISEYFTSSGVTIIDYVQTELGSETSIKEFCSFISSPILTKFKIKFELVEFCRPKKIESKAIGHAIVKQRLIATLDGTVSSERNKNSVLSFFFILSSKDISKDKFEYFKIAKIEDGGVCNNDIPEQIFWDCVNIENTLNAYNNYIQEYPNGRHLNEAKTKLKDLNISEDESPITIIPASADTINKHEQYLSLHSGVCLYHGDLTSSVKTFRPTVQLAYKYQLKQNVSLGVLFSYFRLMGDDKYAKNLITKNRNLSFYSNTSELSLIFDYSLINESNSSLLKTDRIGLNIFSGIGIIRFNPFTFYMDKKYFLKPLNTEGQTINSSIKEYSDKSLVIPLGISMKYKFNKKYNLSIEAGYRFTTTDYLDDVSGKYYDKEEIRTIKGNIAANLSDRRFQVNGIFNDEFRGNPNNKDGYFSLTLGLEYQLQ